MNCDVVTDGVVCGKFTTNWIPQLKKSVCSKCSGVLMKRIIDFANYDFKDESSRSLNGESK